MPLIFRFNAVTRTDQLCGDCAHHTWRICLTRNAWFVNKTLCARTVRWKQNVFLRFLYTKVVVKIRFKKKIGKHWKEKILWYTKNRKQTARVARGQYIVLSSNLYGFFLCWKVNSEKTMVRCLAVKHLSQKRTLFRCFEVQSGHRKVFAMLLNFAVF